MSRLFPVAAPGPDESAAQLAEIVFWQATTVAIVGITAGAAPVGGSSL